MTVLVVEDRVEDFSEYLYRVAARGDRLRVASTTQEAITLLRLERFDLVLLDLNIPLGIGDDVGQLTDSDYNGLYVVEVIEALSPPVPRIVCITNYTTTASNMFRGKKVEVIAKTAYLAEFDRVVYGERN